MQIVMTIIELLKEVFAMEVLSNVSNIFADHIIKSITFANSVGS